jgi:hypothetical protein
MHSLNASGSLTGKFVDQEHVVDYMWSHEKGLHVITIDATKDAFPRINNKGQVAGILTLYDPSSLYELATGSRAQAVYLFDPQEGLKILGFPPLWKKQGFNSIVVADINDKGQILLANHSDPRQATKFGKWENGQFILLQTLSYTPVAINNHSDVLSFCIDESYVSFLTIYNLQVFNLETKNHHIFDQSKPYVAIDLNDHREIIATDKFGQNGFQGSPETGLLELGSFVPRALNNQGEIVGRLNDSVWLRKCDGSMFDLNTVVETGAIAGFERITDVLDINDHDQIAVMAKVNGKERVLRLDPLVMAQ